MNRHQPRISLASAARVRQGDCLVHRRGVRERGIVCERWQKVRGWKKGESVETSQFDLSESPMAYKDIENVMNSQKDLVGKCVRLVPLACLKG